MEVNDFAAIRISLASPEQILSWSHGEVLKPETINYRTLKPERDGLFCERIFGPTKDYQCACGKYKRARFEGIVCEKCGVEVTHSSVRRERMGHISLASPVSHIWYVRGVPSRMGLLLDVSPRNLERVLYFAQYIITEIDEEARQKAIQKHKRELAIRSGHIDNETNQRISLLEQEHNEKMEELSAQEEKELAELEERLAAETSQVMTEGQKIQNLLSELLGKEAPEDVKLPWEEKPIVEKGEEVDQKHLLDLNDIVQERVTALEEEYNEALAELKERFRIKREALAQELEEQIAFLQESAESQKEQLRMRIEDEIEELKDLRERDLLTDTRYSELRQIWGDEVFKAGMGAEAILELLKKLDLDKLSKELRLQMQKSRSKQIQKKAAKRLRVVEAFRKSGNKPEWMILTVLPVIPPDLRPMVQLDGGRFATSDLNDLYRRVINRNNRLKRLLDLGAPDVIVRNEKRMLQEAVDSLIDNSRGLGAVSRSGKRQLKSLSEILKGKQGRFRRNLLGKRVDYSGRSVIVVGPNLKLHQCGLPKKMALELFKPFVMRRLVEYGYAHNIKSAKKMVERQSVEVWDVLAEVVKERPVMLNRAPTLHRLSIQAFEVVLIEGSAIQLHPLACAAFNADFDGDQMAVHVPLSQAAVEETRTLMLSTKNLLKPANGEPIVGPSKDMVMGCYYLTVRDPKAGEVPGVFGNFDEVLYLYDIGKVGLRSTIKLRYIPWFQEWPIEKLGLSDRVYDALMEAGVDTVGKLVSLWHEKGDKGLQAIKGIGPKAIEELHFKLEENTIYVGTQPASIIETTVGRVIFNSILPPELRFINREMDKKALNDLVGECYQRLGPEATVEMVDKIKDIGFAFAERSGTSMAVSDILVPETKAKVLEETAKEVEKIERQYRRGLITAQEEYEKVVELWTRATDKVTEEVRKLLDPASGLGAMSRSGATKGGIQPIRQLAGMRGLMADPAGRIIPLPIRSNFREGLTALEYFLSTHGARKGLADTALRTADAGYLTRRLVDVAQDVIVTEEDCGTHEGIWITKEDSEKMQESFRERAFGRVVAAPVISPASGEIIVPEGEIITEKHLDLMERAGVDKVYVRSPLTCNAEFGVCRKCYGQDMARGGLINLGEAVGIIAAESIGEPGTQLTLRTFHTGGVAGAEDITQGLPRVEELFEARSPKGEAVVAEIEGVVEFFWEDDIRMVRVTNIREETRTVEVPGDYERLVQDGEEVSADEVIAQGPDGENILAGASGKISWEQLPDGTWEATIRWETSDVWESPIPATARLRVEPGQRVMPGQAITEGPKDPKRVLKLQGQDAARLYLLEEIQRVYRSQGVSIHDKHIEVIIRQMMRRVRVRTPGDTDFLPGELVDKYKLASVNADLVAKGKKPATAEPVLLGISKAALNTESFLAAASFQETTRVLTDAAVRGAVDELRGLKENVIIGKMIPVGTGFRPYKPLTFKGASGDGGEKKEEEEEPTFAESAA